MHSALEACCGAADLADEHDCLVVAAVANRFVRWLHHQPLPEALAI